MQQRYYVNFRKHNFMKIKITKTSSPFSLTSGKYLQPGRKKKSAFKRPAGWIYSAEIGFNFIFHGLKGKKYNKSLLFVF